MRINWITIRKVQDFPFFIFVLFTCTYFIYYDFGISAAISLGISLFIVVISFVYQLFKEKGGCFFKLDAIRVSYFLIAMVLLINFLRLDSEQSRANIYYIGIIISCAFILLLSIPEQNTAKTILNTFLIAALAVAAFTLFFSLFGRLYSTMIYPLLGEERKQYSDLTAASGYGVSLGGVTFTAYMLIMGIAVIYGNIISPKKKNGLFYLLQLALCGILLISLVFLGRKGELVSLILAFGLIWIIDGFQTKGKMKKYIFTIVTLVLVITILGAIYLLPVFLSKGYMDRYISFFDQYSKGQDITSGRVQLWKWGWELFVQYPVFGGGLNSFSKYIPESARMSASGTRVSSPHIVYLHLLCEYGIVGFFLIMIPLGYILIKTLRQYIQLTKLRINNGYEEEMDKTIWINAVSLFMQFFFAFLFFFDQTFSLVQFWLFYCIVVYLSSSAYYANRHSVAERRVAFSMKTPSII